jgi:hypothetical protein
MATTIPNLWSDDISVDVLSPLAILRAQAAQLGRMTKGLLKAEVATTTGTNKWVQHQLDLMAPVLDYYRHRVLTARHHMDMVYPVTVDAECFNDPTGSPELGSSREAPTEEEFIQLVRQALQSNEVKLVIQSLIARSNEFRGTPPLAEDEEEPSES